MKEEDDMKEIKVEVAEEEKDAEEDIKEEEIINTIERQLSITSGPHQIQMISEDPKEHIDYLLDRALVALEYCRKSDSIIEGDGYN